MAESSTREGADHSDSSPANWSNRSSCTWSICKRRRGANLSSPLCVSGETQSGEEKPSIRLADGGDAVVQGRCGGRDGLALAAQTAAQQIQVLVELSQDHLGIVFLPRRQIFAQLGQAFRRDGEAAIHQLIERWQRGGKGIEIVNAIGNSKH